jgi:hypothetical protein
MRALGYGVLLIRVKLGSNPDPTRFKLGSSTSYAKLKQI